MSVSLKEVLDLFEFSADIQQQIPLIQLAALRGCFGEKYQGKLISAKDEILELLNKSFSSAEEGIEWWVKITQEKWLRESFHKEGISKNKDPVINVVRWLDQDAKKETKENDHEESQLFEIFKQLKLIEAVKWPEDKKAHAVIHGGMEDAASERLNFIPAHFSGVLYYLTNPRGLFNNEPSLAPILAAWFEKSESAELIQSVLNKYQDPRTCTQHWLKDLASLKKEIMNVLGESEWPEGKGWYAKDPETKSLTGKISQLEELANSNGYGGVFTCTTKIS